AAAAAAAAAAASSSAGTPRLRARASDICPCSTLAAAATPGDGLPPRAPGAGRRGRRRAAGEAAVAAALAGRAAGAPGALGAPRELPRQAAEPAERHLLRGADPREGHGAGRVAGGPAQAHAAAGPAGLAGHVGRPSGARRPRGAPRVWGGAEAARGAAARHARLGRRARLCARQARGAAERPGRRGALSSGCFPRAPRRPGEDEAEDRPSRGEPAVPRSMGTGSESACRADAAPPALQSTRADVDTSYLSRTVRRLKEPFYSSRGHPLRCVRTAVIPPIPLP
ncbi:unnamed protein product, partial [Prorocentrum cordatum]